MSVIFCTPDDAKDGSVAAVREQHMVWAAVLGLRAMRNFNERFAPIDFVRK